MRRTRYLSLSLAVILTVVLSSSYSKSATAQANTRYFTETGHNVSGKFLDYWNKHGGLSQQGYPISEEMSEVSDIDGKAYTVQYFERAVFEYHPENKSPYDVLLTPLGSLRLKSYYSSGNPTTEADAGSAGYFPQTKHSVTGRFLQYWQEHGGLAQQGYPITEEFTEKSDLDGNTYQVQYFERAVFELHPENQPPNDVLLSQLGTFRYGSKYGPVSRVDPVGGNPPANNPTPTNVPSVNNPPPSPTTQPQPTNPPAPAPMPGASQQFSGHGIQATAMFHLNAGLVVFHSTHTNGTSNFIVHLKDKDGQDVLFITNAIGEYNGRFADNVPASGDYLLSVDADGDWTVTIDQPQPPAYSSPPSHQSWSGHGDDVTSWVTLKQGLARFSFTHNGSSNFIIHLLDSDGNVVEFLANEIGAVNANTAISVESNGVYLLQITADGNWTINADQ